MSKNRKKERKEKESQGGASDQRIHLPVKETQETGQLRDGILEVLITRGKRNVW